jgi:hypothetical protein
MPVVLNAKLLSLLLFFCYFHFLFAFPFLLSAYVTFDDPAFYGSEFML